MFIHANLFFLLGFCYLVGLKLSFSRLCLSKLSHERYEMEAHPSMFSERAAFFSFYDPAEQALQSGIYLQNCTLQPHAIHFEKMTLPPSIPSSLLCFRPGPCPGEMLGRAGHRAGRGRAHCKGITRPRGACLGKAVRGDTEKDKARQDRASCSKAIGIT